MVIVRTVGSPLSLFDLIEESDLLIVHVFLGRAAVIPGDLGEAGIVLEVFLRIFLATL